MLVFQLDNNPDDFENSMILCNQWYDAQGDISEWSDDIVNTCPFFLEQAIYDDRLQPLMQSDEINVSCFQRTVVNMHGASFKCCYKENDGSIVDAPLSSDYNFIGFLNRHPYEEGTNNDYYNEDVKPYEHCCIRSNTQDFCDMYKEKRPIMSSRNYANLKSAWLQGSIHAKTLDENMLSLLGYGEYVLLRSRSTSGVPVMVQLRTAVSANQSPDSSNAVIISGVSAKIGERAPSLQAYLNSDGTDIDVWADNEPYSDQELVDAWIHKNIDSSLRRRRSLTDEESTVTFVFEVGASLIVFLRANQLGFILRIPETLGSSDFDGLLGNMDGDATNDFRNSAGDVFNSASTVEELFSYTETWMLRNLYGVTNADANTIFYSYSSPSSANNYFQAGFTPQLFEQADYTSEVIEACTIDDVVSWECAYDYTVTGINTIEYYSTYSNEWNHADAILRNSPPVFDRNVPKIIEATVGISKTISLKVKDSDPYNISVILYNLDTDESNVVVPQSTEYNENDQSITATFTFIPRSYQGYLIYQAIDVYGARSTFTPVYSLCDCDEEYLCDHQHPTYFRGNFRYGLCQCQPGYAGQFCEEDLNGCLNKQCFGGCADRMPNQVTGDYRRYEFTCDLCPNGFESDDSFLDGVVCNDVNECVLPSSDSRRHNCEQTCQNTAGSYLCGCVEGYILNADMTSCDDIVECGTSSDTCDQNYGTCVDTAGRFMCGCEEGYELAPGSHSCVDINECYTDNGNCSRLCINLPGSHQCDCGYGYLVNANDPFTCVVTDVCSQENLCDQICNNMFMTSETAHYECDCNSGFDLQANFWECLPSNPCETSSCDADNGLCSVVNGEVSCSCKRGYQLDSSDRRTCISIDECTTGDHHCGDNSDCRNSDGDLGQYTCACHDGYEHSLYSEQECVNINECVLNDTLCEHICIDSPGSYSCDCQSGYQLNIDMSTCSDVNECAAGVENLCSADATCTNLDGTYDCFCNTGYTGNGYVCHELDECTHDNGGCSQECHNTPGSFYCTCLHGYTLDYDRRSCLDIDECSLPEMVCAHNCENSNGSFSCSCQDRFTLNNDGLTCDPSDPCVFKWCGSDGNQCIVEDGEETCVCASGYQYDATLDRCINIDECSTLSYTQSRKKRSVGENSTEAETTTSMTPIEEEPEDEGPDYIDQCVAPIATCVDDVGSYHCVCDSGYELREDQLSCMDIDECVNPDYQHSCDESSAHCVNSVGGYSCDCQDGFRYNTEFSCTDINECDSLDVSELICSQHATCVNSQGGFTCTCFDGFVGDGTNCQDVNECNVPTLNTCSMNQTCTNNNGSFTCQCKSGYQFSVELDRCVDINECDSTSLNPCRDGCENLIGSFRCTCQSGYQINPIDGTTCQIAEQCDSPTMRTSCQHDCVRINNADYCRCHKGYIKEELLCHDIDECTTTNSEYRHKCDEANSDCVNNNGSYTCDCHRYHILDSDGLSCSQTNGNWGAWNNWLECSMECNGRRTRTRNCNSPPPTDGRFCEGETVQYAMCNYAFPDCYALETEASVSAFVDFPNIIPELWESISLSFMNGVRKGFNFYCWENADNYERCCNKPLTDESILELRRDFVKNVDISVARGYPRDHNNGARVMIYISMPQTNDLCGDLSEIEVVDLNNTIVGSSRRKRDLQEDDYVIPRLFLIERLNATDTRNYINQEISDQESDDDLAEDVWGYELEEAIHEDIPTTTPAPRVEDSGLNIVVVTLAVIFSVFGMTVLAFVLFILLRPGFFKTKDPEEGMKGTALNMFKDKGDEEEYDSEDEAIRKVFEKSDEETKIDSSSSEPDSSEEEDNEEQEEQQSGDDDLHIEKRLVSARSNRSFVDDNNQSLVEDPEDETENHPHRPMSNTAEEALANPENEGEKDQYEEVNELESKAEPPPPESAWGTDNEGTKTVPQSARSQRPQTAQSQRPQSATSQKASSASNSKAPSRAPSAQSQRPASSKSQTTASAQSQRPPSAQSKMSEGSNRPPSTISNHSARDTLL